MKRRKSEHASEPEHRRTAYEFMGAVLALNAYSPDVFIAAEDQDKTFLRVFDWNIREAGNGASVVDVVELQSLSDSIQRLRADQTTIVVTVQGVKKSAVRVALQGLTAISEGHYRVAGKGRHSRLEVISERNEVTGEQIRYWQGVRLFTFR